jgi:competence protein ComEC
MKKIYYILPLGLLLVGVVWRLAQPHEYLQVIFFNIGQGDSALVRTPDGQDILLDGGPDRKILTKLGDYLPWADRTIDLVVLSHPHADHVAGLNYVLERYRVRRVLLTGAVHTTPEYIRFLQIIKEKNIPVTWAVAGQTLEFSGQVKLEVLWPVTSLQGQSFSDLNTSSIVNKIIYGNTAILFTGDTPAENERQLLNTNASLRADILKVAHQGSKTSSTEEFIKAVAPQIAVISVGRNNYGHPHAEVVNRLKRLVPVVLRTDETGDIIYWSDGHSFSSKRPNLIFSKFVLP